jgi:hypothetical protein
MEFFDKKEEVIDLQLTQYGKYLLSLGKMKPVYYAFYDDGIIYDSEYAGFVEDQNTTEGRIQSNTPNTKTIHNFHSIEDDLARAVETKNSGDENLAQLMLQQTPEKSQVLINPLANSDLSTNKVPAWNITMLSGQILTGSTTSTLTLSSSATVLNIPQVEVEINYDVVISQSDPLSQEEIDAIARGDIDGLPQEILDALGNGIMPSGVEPFVFEDGTFFTINRKDLIFQIIEEHVPKGNDNFEIEIFALEDVDGNGKIQNTSLVTEVKQLRLLTEPDLVVNDILLDEAEGNLLPVSDIDSSFADYYFDIELDNQIDSSIICENIKNGDKDLYKFARKDFDCDEKQANYEYLNPYSQKQTSAECEDNS